MMLSTHSQKLERWLGIEECEHLSRNMKDWYGGPIAIAGVPGVVYARGGGDFVGRIEAGGFASWQDYAFDSIKRRAKSMMRRRLFDPGKLNAGFSSLSDLISEATAGKRRDFIFSKNGVTGVSNATNTLWYVGAQPAAGGNAGAAPGGTVPDSTSTGAFPFTNPTSGDTQHFVTCYLTASASPSSMLLYDRLFSVTKTMSSSATEAVTGVPTRYTSTTSTNQDYAGNNFLTIECRTALAAVNHNWTVCTYTDQDGNTGASLPSVTGNNACIQYRLDIPVGGWFCPLATGDTGIKNLTQMQCSSASVTGAIDFTIGHPLAFMPVPLASFVCVADGVNSAFNLVRIFDNACMAMLELVKLQTVATTFTGQFTTVAG